MKLRITVEGVAYEVEVEVLEDGGTITAPPPFVGAPASSSGTGGKAPARAGKAAPASKSAGGPGEKSCKAPIAGTVVQVKVKPGDTVAINQVLVIMEAMKMETNIASPVAGKVKSVVIKTGQAVKAGEILVEFE